jgi:hypothetical protein
MVDHYYIPHQYHAPEPTYTPVEATLQQQVQEAVQAAVPPIINKLGNIYLYVTVNIHYCDHAARRG